MSVYNISGNSIGSNGSIGVINIAASDSSAGDKAKADLVCTGTGDNAVIQSAIDSFGEHSGVIQLANGHYYFDEFSVHDGYYYGLYFPKSQREVILRGMNHNHKSDNVSYNAIDECAVFEVTQTAYAALPSNQESYVVGSNRTYQFPYKVIGVEAISFTLPDYQKPIIGVDGAYCADMHVERCFFKSNGNYSDDSGVNPKCVAVRGCGQGNIGYNYYFAHIKVIGWGTGFQITGEHLLAIDCIAQRTAYGFIIGNSTPVPHPRGERVGGHPITMINCGAEFNNQAAIYFGTNEEWRNGITIIDFNMEAGQSASNPWASDILVTAEEGSNYFGSLSYACLRNADPWLHIQKNCWDTLEHGKNIKTTDMVAPLSGTTANRPTDPVYLSQYFDTTLNKMLTWNGAEWV